MEIKTRWAQDRSGNVLPFAKVSLYYQGTDDLVSGLEDKDGSPLENPFQADVNGKAVFAAPDGQYDIEFNGGPRESRASIQFLDVSGALQVVENMPTLRSITGNNGRDYILAKFHTSEGDGGGGDFYWASGEAPGTYVDNGGTIIVPTGGDGSAAWVREFDGDISVKDFGAVGNGVANDTTAIQKALDAVADGDFSLFFPGTGTYKASGLTLANGKSYCLIGEGATIDAGGADCLVVDGASLTMRGVNIQGADDAILYTSATAAAEVTLSLTDCQIRDCSRGIEADRSQPNEVLFKSFEIKGCAFSKNGIDIYVSTHPVERVKITGCNFSDGGYRAVSITGNARGDHIISNNVFRDYLNSNVGSDPDGQFLMLSGNRVVVDSNVFTNLMIGPSTQGSDTEGVRLSCSQAIVSNNVFTDAGMAEAVLALKSGKDHVVTGNVFRCTDGYNALSVASGYNTRAILAATNTKISDNIFINFVGTCVDTPDSTSGLGTIEISNNLFVDCPCTNYSGNSLLRLNSSGTRYVVRGNTVKVGEGTDILPANIFRITSATYVVEDNDFSTNGNVFTNVSTTSVILSGGNYYRGASRILATQDVQKLHSKGDRYYRGTQAPYVDWLGGSGSCPDLQIENLAISWVDNSDSRFIGVRLGSDAVGFMRGEFTFRDTTGAATALHNVEIFIKRSAGVSTIEETNLDKFYAIGSPTLTKQAPNITSANVAFRHPSGGSAPSVEGTFSLTVRAVT